MLLVEYNVLLYILYCYVIILVTCTAAEPTFTEPLLIGNITRRDGGDVFQINGSSCGSRRCSDYAALALLAGRIETCDCTCTSSTPLYREDIALCVNDIPECTLANFGTGSSSQRIPLVYLPLQGQIIHPSKEITFPGVKTPICAVSGAQFLTRKGFVDLRNTFDADVPFTLFRDEGRTFLQWSGETELRARMSGRFVLVRLLCRDVSLHSTHTLYSGHSSYVLHTTTPANLHGVFTPCVAFRIQGEPMHFVSNVSEVQFIASSQSLDHTTNGLTTTEYVVIGISSLLLGLIYVASVLLYLHIKKKRRDEEKEEKKLKKKKLLMIVKHKNTPERIEHDLLRIENERINIPNIMESNTEGVVKNNPLLNIDRHFHKGHYQSDSGSNLSDGDDTMDGNDCNKRISRSQITAAVIHSGRSKMMNNDCINELSRHHEESGIEKLPDEHVSIVETMDAKDDKPEIVRSMGHTRRKLYFNPAYFEPLLMADPPPAALEFLTKIREVITLAKHKMAAKRFQPVLNEIPEEETYNSIDFYQSIRSQSGSLISLKRENVRKRPVECFGCPGCRMKNEEHEDLKNDDNVRCNSCIKKGKGEKQNSIRKWLEDIPNNKCKSIHNSGMLNSLLSLPVPEANNHKFNIKHSKTRSLYAEDINDNFMTKPKSTTMSVRSEPTFRSYNIPLPDFNLYECRHKNNIFGSTIAKTEDITPIGLSEYNNTFKLDPIINHQKNKFITKKKSMPDMISEALVLDKSNALYRNSPENESFEKEDNSQKLKKFNIENNIDYETDSLERLAASKGLSTPTEYGEFPSSEASPSLSTALPLDEEMTMTNAVYKSHSNTPSPLNRKSLHHNYYETIGDLQKQACASESGTKDSGVVPSDDYSLVSEVYVNNNYNFESNPTTPSGSECSFGRKKIMDDSQTNANIPGRLTIEVKDPPENYIKIHESDGFEPDTLDRKNTKYKIVESFSRSTLNSISDSNSDADSGQVKSTGTFNSHNEYYKRNQEENEYSSLQEFNKREPATDINNGPKSLDGFKNNMEAFIDWSSEEGRILTLELRHSKRQRQVTPPCVKQVKSLVRPDVLPPLPPTGESEIYELPKMPPQKVESKNYEGRVLDPRKLQLGQNKSVKKQIEKSASLRASASKLISDHCIAEKAEPKINTNTFVKSNNHSKLLRSKKRSMCKEDSGYLSSDSNSPRHISRKIILQRALSASESEETENEARSESGAESVETHSVFFGSLRKFSLQNKELETTKENKKSFFKLSLNKK